MGALGAEAAMLAPGSATKGDQCHLAQLPARGRGESSPSLSRNLDREAARRSELCPSLRCSTGLPVVASWSAMMLAWDNSGFTVNETAHIAGRHRAGLERLLHYCA